MELLLTRQNVLDDATIGTLEVDGVFLCHTLEDLQRKEKIFGKTAIPAGSYRVTLAESPRFSAQYKQRGLGPLLPRLHDVPEFDGVLIHIGNLAVDTHGCILVGKWKPGLGAKIEASTDAYRSLHQKLSDSPTPITLTVRNGVAEG